MNKLLASLLVSAVALPAAATAATTLISSSVLNGGFEARITDNTYATTYNAGTGYWFNYGSALLETASLYNTVAQAGTYSGITSAGSQPSIGTNWNIAAGDVYNLSFSARSTNVSVLAANPIRWELYYYSTQGDVGFNETDANSGVVLFSGSVTNSTVTAANTWATASLGDFDTGTLSGSAMTAAAGKELYLRFYRTSGDAVFPVIDNVTLTAVPEPSTYGLMGAGALAAVALVRRRRRA